MLQIRAHLRDIFAEAVDQDFLPKDPARKVEVPKQLRDTDTTVLSWEQLRSVLAHLSLEVEIAKRTGNTPQPLAEKKVVTFGWFVRHRWLPLKEANWKEETAQDKKCILLERHGATISAN